MNLNSDYVPYLKGERFSDNFRMVMAERTAPLTTRLDYMAAKLRGKRVLHIGCLGHASQVAELIQGDTWLHKDLTELAAECLGIDVDAEAAERARALGYDNVLICDIAADRPHPKILGTRWEYAVLGEVLEHVNDPVSFLAAIVGNYGAAIERLIITVPNAFRLGNFRDALRHQERINTDHRYWFTPYTLAKVATVAGIDVSEYELCVNLRKEPRRGLYGALIKPALLRRFPLLRPCIVLEGSLRADARA